MNFSPRPCSGAADRESHRQPSQQVQAVVSALYRFALLACRRHENWRALLQGALAVDAELRRSASQAISNASALEECRSADRTEFSPLVGNPANWIPSEFSQKSFAQTQELDSSYPIRLRGEKNVLSEKEYKTRYNALKNKQEKLKEFGLYESKQEFLTYSLDDAKALSVYLKDIEKKLSVFDDLLEKLEIFTSILNERRFTFKSINILSIWTKVDWKRLGD